MALKKGVKKRFELGTSERSLVTVATVLLSIAALVWLDLNGIGLLNRWALAILVLLVSGFVIGKANGLKGAYGAYMFGSRRGIAFIDSLASHGRRFWIAMADWGLVLSFGLLSYPLFRKQISLKMYVVGMASIALILFLVLPYMSVALQFINLPQVNQRIVASASATQQSGIDYTYYITTAATFIIGMSALVVVTIFYNAGKIIYGIVLYLASLSSTHPNGAAVSTLIPGIAPVIPFITIAGFAGIIALAILLIIHEFSHGILSRIAKVKLKSIGLLLFGIIPLGAFVEPDDKEVKKLDKERKSRIFIAGVSSNFLAMLIFFVLMLIMIYLVLPGFVSTKVLISGTIAGTPAYNVIPAGSQVLSWNGHAIRNLSSFTVAAKNDTPFSKVSVVTNEGGYLLTANATGKIGVYVQQVTGPIRNDMASYSAFFIYTVIGLSFLLNFLVAIVNLLPIPGFDGWQVYRTKMKSTKYLNLLAALILIALVVNALPWIWLG